VSLLDGLGDLLRQATSGGASEGDIHSAYDRVATAVPHSSLKDGLTHAFNSDQTPPFEQMVAGMFSQSSPDQKAGVLNQILGRLPPGAVAQILGSVGGLGSLGGALAGGSVSPQQAEQVSPEAVQVLAQHAASKDPSIVDSVAGFYAQHSTLVKAIGAGALAMIMSHISQSRR
jgi:hypothetical protein